MTEIDENFMRAVEAIAEQCAPQIDTDANTLVKSAIDAGEWGEALTEIGSGLYQAGATITKAQRDSLGRLFETANLPTEALEALVIEG